MKQLKLVSVTKTSTFIVEERRSSNKRENITAIT